MREKLRGLNLKTRGLLPWPKTCVQIREEINCNNLGPLIWKTVAPLKKMGTPGINLGGLLQILGPEYLWVNKGKCLFVGKGRPIWLK